MDDFETIFHKYAKSETSKELKYFLKTLYDSLISISPNLEEIGHALKELFTYLDSSEGKNKDNYWTTDLFISDYEEMWKPDLSSLPEKYKMIFEEIENLHGAVEQPQYHVDAKQILRLIEAI